MQSRLNVINLVQGGQVHAPSLRAFTRLFDLLGLPRRELSALASNLQLAQGGSSGRSPALVPNAPLWPQELAQLAWYGLSPRSLALLQDFVTLLPGSTPVNLNTAPVEVVYACLEAFELADAHRLVAARTTAHFASLDDVAKAKGSGPAQLDAAQHSVASRFFEVRGRLQIEQDIVEEYSLVQREAAEVRTLWRRRGSLPPMANLQ